MKPLFLKVFYRGKLLKVCPFTDDQISIGSGEGLSLKLKGLAPWHIIIEKKWDRYTIFDLGSDTGTYIGGQKIAGENTLKSGSVFQIGPYQIQFFVGPPPVASSPVEEPGASPADEVPSSGAESVPSISGVSFPSEKPAPPTSEVFPPEKEAAPPTDETFPPKKEAAPPTDETFPPKKEAAPPTDETFPQKKEAAPPTDETFPPEKEAAPPTDETFPPKKEAAPPTDETFPPEKEAAPPTDETFPPEKEAAPPTDETFSVPKESSFPEEQTLQGDSLQEIPHPPVESDQGLHPVPGEVQSPPAVKAFKKPEGKGFWRTFAPFDKVESLDEYLEPSVGNLIEVLISWKDRILNSFHFSEKGYVHMGSDKNCEIPVSNLLGLRRYKLLEINSGAKIFLDHGVKGALIQKKEGSRAVHPLPGNQSLILRPYEIVRIDFRNLLRVYVRIKNRPSSVIPAGLFNLTFSETAVLFFSFLTTSLLLFYAGLYAPTFLQKEEDFLEKEIRSAVVKFEKKPRQPPSPKPRVVKMKLSDKTRAMKKKSLIKQPRVKKKKTQRKKTKPVVVRQSKKPKVVPKKTAVIKKKGKKPGRISTVAKGRKPPVKQKVAVGSARPGGSLKTGKTGSSAKTVAPDPTKTGLLGVFGGGGKLAKLDTGATGSAAGGLLGLAETSTGFAGTKEGYEGEGVGTKTKELATGGQGTALVGIKGIKTKGQGGNLLGKGGGKGGSLGSRGRVSINIGTDDIEVEGEIDKAGILRVIRRNRVKFDKCYQFSLQREASLEGMIKMEWQILSNGSVRAVKALQDGVGSDSLSNCMRRVLSRFAFSGASQRSDTKGLFSLCVFNVNGEWEFRKLNLWNLSNQSSRR